MIHRVLGTAGHIDHGKTALVRALTGVDTDRLVEERRRGITIELGFAPLDLGECGIVGVVDVPGHERFVRTMLAGAGGIDIVLLVVAADESIMPQTREHFDICRLLGVQGGVIALTKIDLVDPELRAVVREEVAEWVAGSFLEGALIVPVSALTGEGIEELRHTLAECIAVLPAPRRPDFVRLPVDRSFSMRGFGTVVTGTLLSGSVRTGDPLTVWPAGGPVWVRLIQVHGHEVEEAFSGQRTALNVTGANRRVPVRGDLLAGPQRMAASSLVDVRLELLPSLATGLGEQARVRFHLGTAEREARVRLLEERRTVAPGESALAQIRLARPLAAAVGDRFIVRRPSPPLTLGGGIVLDPVPHKHRRGDAAVLARLARLESADGPARLESLVEEAGERAISRRDLVVRTGLSPEAVAAAATRLAAAGRCLEDGAADGNVLSHRAREKLVSRMLDILDAFHRARPLERGMSLQELRRRAAPHTPEPLLEALLRRTDEVGRIRIEGQHVASGEHRVSLEPEEESLLGEVENQVREGALDPPDPAELLARRGCAAERATALVQVLRDRGRLIRVGSGYLLHHEVLADLKQRLWQRRESEPLIDVAQFKELAGVTRRRAIPLLEYLDASHITTRRGDRRFIQPPAADQE